MGIVMDVPWALSVCNKSRPGPTEPDSHRFPARFLLAQNTVVVAQLIVVCWSTAGQPRAELLS